MTDDLTNFTAVSKELSELSEFFEEKRKITYQYNLQIEQARDIEENLIALSLENNEDRMPQIIEAKAKLASCNKAVAQQAEYLNTFAGFLTDATETIVIEVAGAKNNSSDALIEFISSAVRSEDALNDFIAKDVKTVPVKQSIVNPSSAVVHKIQEVIKIIRELEGAIRELLNEMDAIIDGPIKEKQNIATQEAEQPQDKDNEENDNLTHTDPGSIFNVEEPVRPTIMPTIQVL